MSKMNFAVLVVVSAFLGAAFAPAPAAELPPALLGYLRVENPDGMLKGLEGFLQGLLKLEVPPPVAGSVTRQLGRMIENPDLLGVDLSGPAVLASFQPDQAEAWAVSLSLSSPEAYRRALVKSWELQSSDEKTGISLYRREIRELDSEAFGAADPEERKDMDSFYRTREKILAVAWQEKRAWISPRPELLKDVASLVPADFPVPISGALVAKVRVEPLLEIAEESLREVLGRIPVSPEGASLPTGNFQAQAQAYLDLYLHYARQVDNYLGGLTLDGSGVKLEEMIQARPGTGLARFLSAQKKGKLSLARFLEPSPWLAFSGRIDEPEMLADVYARLFAVFQQALPETGEDDGGREASRPLAAVWSSYLPLMEDYLKECAGDELAFSVSSSPGCFMTGVTIQRIRSVKAFREYIRKSVLSNREILAPFYAGLGISVDDSGVEKPEIFGKVEIYTLRMTFDFKKLSQGQEIPGDQKKIFTLMEAPLVVQMAASEDLAVAVTEMSWGGEPNLKDRLERIAAGKSSFDTDRLGASWSDANGVIYFSLSRYLNDFLAPMIDLASPPPPPPAAPPAGEVIRALGRLDLPLVAYLTVDGPNLKAAVDVPMERIQAAKSAIDDVRAKEQAGKSSGK